MKKSSLLCFGEISWDRLWVLTKLPGGQENPLDPVSPSVVRDQEGPGGCALNTAYVLAAFAQQFRLTVTLGGNFLGQDAHAAEVIRRTRALGISGHIQTRTGLKTPFCQVMVDAKTGARDFVLDHRTIQTCDPSLWKPVFEGGPYDLIFIQPYLPQITEGFLKEAKPRFPKAKWISQDLTPDSPFLSAVDILQISLPEASTFAPEPLQALAAPYHQAGLSQLLITAGAHGVAVSNRESGIELLPPIAAPKVVDTTGCGDAFRAGVMLGLSQGRSLAQSVTWGQHFGAHKATLFGSHFTSPIPLPP